MHPYAPFMFGRAGMMIGGLVMFLITLAVIAAIVVAIVLLVRHGKRHNSSNYTYNNPKASVYHALAILDERYAKGELTDEEYEQKKAALKKE